MMKSCVKRCVKRKLAFHIFAQLFSSRERISVLCCCERFSFFVSRSVFSSHQLSVKILSEWRTTFLNKLMFVIEFYWKFPLKCIDKSVQYTVVNVTCFVTFVSEAENLAKGKFENERFAEEFSEFAADTKNKRKSFFSCICFFFRYCFKFLSRDEEKKRKTNKRSEKKICWTWKNIKKMEKKSARNFLCFLFFTMLWKLIWLKARWPIGGR